MQSIEDNTEDPSLFYTISQTEEIRDSTIPSHIRWLESIDKNEQPREDDRKPTFQLLPE